MVASAQKSMATIDQFVNRVGRVKAAEEAHTEAGSIGGETEHPVKNVDDRTEVAQEGARSKENEKDVKEEQGAPGVNSAPEATAKTGAARLAKGRTKAGEGGAVSSTGSAADDAEPSPLNPQPTGKTPDLETSGTKAGKKDPGSSHPARTDNESLDGHKYSADADPIKMAGDLKTVGDDLLARLAWLSEAIGDSKQAADVQRVAGGAPASTKQAAAAPQTIDPHVQMQLGWELAALVTGQMDKQAADRMVHTALTDVIATGVADAVKVAHYLDNFFAAAEASQKQAEGGPPPDPAMMGGGGGGGPPMMPPPGGGGGGPPPGMDGGGGGDGGGADMLAALGGGQSADGMGGGGPPGMGGGGPPGLEGGGGGPPGAGGGGGGPGEAAELAALLEHLGVSREELEQAMSEEEGGGGGGGGLGGGGDHDGDEGGGGLPPGAGAGGGGLEHQAGDRRGTTQKRGAAKQGDYRTGMRDYITEIIGRSRRGRAG